jgi:hypothetical protein
LGQHTGDGKYDGETFLGRTWMFFSWRVGGGKRYSRECVVETFSEDDASSKQTWVYGIYYMLSSGGLTAGCLQAIVKGVLDPRLTWTDTCTVQASTTRRPSPDIEDSERDVSPRSVTDSTEQLV